MSNQELNKLLKEYIANPNDFYINFNLGIFYYNIGQTATAISFFLRGAERTTLADLQYECMLRAGICFEEQGTRNTSVAGMYQHAIALHPKRPEGYFLLSRFYERTHEWFLSFTFASIGLQVYDRTLPPLMTDVQYPGEYGLLFEKGISAWWCGLCDMSRDILKDILFKEVIEVPYKESCINNLKFLNSWKEKDQLSLPFKTKEEELKALENHSISTFISDLKKSGFHYNKLIEKNYSEDFKDLLVLYLLDEKEEGFYVDIGTKYPLFGNSTYILEDSYKWRGISFVESSEYAQRHIEERLNTAILGTGSKEKVQQFLDLSGYRKQIDYINITLSGTEDSFNSKLLTHCLDICKSSIISITVNKNNTLEAEPIADKLDNIGYKQLKHSSSAHNSDTLTYWYVDESCYTIIEKALKLQIFQKQESSSFWKTTHCPTLEITTTIPKKGCTVDCVFCPQRTLVKAYTGQKKLSFTEYTKIIDKIPKDIRITFAGFTEPWLHRECTDMLLYAYENGHPVSAFTTGIGMKIEDLERIKHVQFDGNANGCFVLHLPDEENYAKHPITPKYIELLEHFNLLRNELHNFRIMCMGTPHSSIRHIFNFDVNEASQMYSRAGNLLGEAILKPELLNLKDKFISTYNGEDPMTCNCDERLYHNVLLPNGDVSLCCMDYGLENILGNLFVQSYEEILPEPYQTFRICNFCENAIEPDVLKLIDNVT